MGGRALQRARTGLVVTGAWLVVWAMAQWADGWWYQRHAARAFAARLAAENELSRLVAPEIGEVTATDATTRDTVDAAAPDTLDAARIEIPRLDLVAMIVDGGSATSLRRGVWHIPGTAAFAEAGNVGLAAHRDTYFRALHAIAVGDTIQIATHADHYTYVVEWTRVVEPRAVDVLDRTPERALTLVTCHPFGYVGRAPNRFIVRARATPSV
jgi:sortase A